MARQNKPSPLSGSRHKATLAGINSQNIRPTGGGQSLAAGHDLIGHASIDRNTDVKPIHFGTPSQISQGSSHAGSLWHSLLPGSAGSAAKLLRGGVIGAVGQLLFSGLGDLFGGGKSTPPPLVRFSLPEPNQQSVEIARGTTTTGSAGLSNTHAEVATYAATNTQIVRAVREALLTSSQLNDVISEL